ncbi:MAG TPA: GxxExxY protein [Petrimonas sp.]|nr:GxxExxY protein [Petrimonas sp.]
MHYMPVEYRELTEKIIGAAYEVHNILGPGFAERVYRNALITELKILGISAKPEYGVTVYYKNEKVGEFSCDIMAEDALIIEIKAVENIEPWHEVQLVNYLNATKTENGLLINFGRSVSVKRKFRKYKPKEIKNE